MSLSPSSDATPVLASAISVRRVRFTQRWDTIDGVRAQAVEVTLANMLPTHLLSEATAFVDRHEVSVRGGAGGVETVAPGLIYRLVPGDQIRVDIYVVGEDKGGVSVVVKDAHGDEVGSSDGWEGSPLVEQWTEDEAVLSRHETPSWVGLFFSSLCGFRLIAT